MTGTVLLGLNAIPWTELNMKSQFHVRGLTNCVKYSLNLTWNDHKILHLKCVQQIQQSKSMQVLFIFIWNHPGALMVLEKSVLLQWEQQVHTLLGRCKLDNTLVPSNDKCTTLPRGLEELGRSGLIYLHVTRTRVPQPPFSCHADSKRYYLHKISCSKPPLRRAHHRIQ